MLELLHNFASLYHSVTHLHSTLSDAQTFNMNNSTVFARCVETVEQLRQRLPEHLAHPRVAIVCGSGLGGLAEVVNKEGVDGEVGSVEWEYKDVPNFPISTGMLLLAYT